MVLLLAILLLVELALRPLAAFGVIPYQRYPTSINPTFWDDINPVFGVWRHSNAELRHVAPCFDLVYRSNSYGARDRERQRQSSSSRRIAVLGDSFVEGFGVERAERFVDLLEEQTGIEHLNFGSSGYFGPIQQWLLYETLVAEFDHTDLFVFLLPDNDYSDNRPEDFSPRRYRPYLRRNGDDFEVYYTVEFDEREREIREWGETIKNSVDNHSYIANLLRTAHRMVEALTTEEIHPDVPPYDAFTDEDLDRLLYVYRKIAEQAGERPMFLISIPAIEDLRWALTRGDDFKLVRELELLASELPGLTYIDLLPFFVEDARRNGLGAEDYSLGCDPHWSSKGHALAAQVLAREIYGLD